VPFVKVQLKPKRHSCTSQRVMPLRGIIDAKERISVKINDDEWLDLKSKARKGLSSITLPCCHHPAFLRTSSKGLKHFVHAKGVSNCDGKPETVEHLKSKIEIFEACEENGWNATLEYSENDWRADVLATKDEMRIAFEVQWSKQTIEETNFRQKRYAESKVRGCWFFRTLPEKFISEDIEEIPAFSMQKDQHGEIVIRFYHEYVPIRGFVDRLLKRKIKYCKNYRSFPKQEIVIEVYGIKCWKCKNDVHLYTVTPRLKSCCGIMQLVANVDFHPNIIEAVKELCSSEGFIIGEIKDRYSRIRRKSYASIGCYYCDAILGDASIEDSFLRIRDSERYFRRMVDLGNVIKKFGGHWCYNENEEFCE